MLSSAAYLLWKTHRQQSQEVPREVAIEQGAIDDFEHSTKSINVCIFFKTKELIWNYQFYGLRRMNYQFFSSRVVLLSFIRVQTWRSPKIHHFMVSPMLLGWVGSSISESWFPKSLETILSPFLRGTLYRNQWFFCLNIYIYIINIYINMVPVFDLPLDQIWVREWSIRRKKSPGLQCSFPSWFPHWNFPIRTSYFGFFAWP